MRPTLSTVFTLSAAVVLLLSGCTTAHVRPVANQRGPAAADEALIEKFVDALVEKSSIGSQEAIEDALTQVVNDNAARLKIGQIDSLDDIAAMSDADQRRIIDELAALPELSQKLALDSQAVDVARGEAVAAEDVKGVDTQDVPNLQRPAQQDGPSFAKFLERSPAMKGDVTRMLQENMEIEQKTGTQVLTKGCDSLQNEASVENLSSIIDGVDQDVAAGKAKDTPTVAKSLEKNSEYVLGTDAQETHERICTLADPNECGIISPKMCN